jgi:hypothetical protein
MAGYDNRSGDVKNWNIPATNLHNTSSKGNNSKSQNMPPGQEGAEPNEPTLQQKILLRGSLIAVVVGFIINAGSRMF